MYPTTVGTCGCSYKDWVGHFYPKGTAAGDYLSFYAERFTTVEVDSSFYACPSPKLVQGWYNKTPAGFGFSLKIPKTITHEKLLADCGKEVDEFPSAARLLKEKLRCCVLQLGYLNPQAFPHFDDFLTRLDGFLANWPKDVPNCSRDQKQALVRPGVRWLLASSRRQLGHCRPGMDASAAHACQSPANQRPCEAGNPGNLISTSRFGASPREFFNPLQWDNRHRTNMNTFGSVGDFVAQVVDA
jgi:hypothetical protein